ncbi:multiple epidermal growth factor-like domains protein 10 [Physella acuta]|uniref:multiple epidermal growth factor-like domains protein 10 n=1 Tax=Physella acuta TaxID=109671 RepID=UPI0027DB26EA|nr:multiple epidermal growth factor-like domains protein 10 [Physella acuta]
MSSYFDDDTRYNDSNAVDGKINADCSNYGCSIANINDKNPALNVSFSTPAFIYYYVFNLGNFTKGNQSDCPTRTYGLGCQKTCNCAVKGETCFVSTGGCPSGCPDGFQGEGCNTKCDAGWFGPNCEYKCHCDKISSCDVDGSCKDKFCDTGFYGKDCLQKCGDGCQQCHHVTGVCYNCSLGYRLSDSGDACFSVCDTGFYGKDCLQKCGDGCQQCHHVTGVCYNCSACFSGV